MTQAVRFVVGIAVLGTIISFFPSVGFAQSGQIYEKARHPLGGNCVAWARSVEHRLPQGLYGMASKVALINSQEPIRGAIAITAESYAGHVGIVRGAQGDDILIEDANYIPGYVTLRAVPKSMIRGYIVLDELGTSEGETSSHDA